MSDEKKRSSQFNKFQITANLGGDPEPIPAKNEGGKNFYTFSIPIDSYKEGEEPGWAKVYVFKEELFPLVQALKKGSLVKITNSKLQIRSWLPEGSSRKIPQVEVIVYDMEKVEKTEKQPDAGGNKTDNQTGTGV